MRQVGTVRQNRGIPYFLLGFIGYYGLISIGSHIPGEAIAKLGFDIWDKALHAAEYLPLGLLAAASLVRPPFGLKRLRVAIAGFILIGVLGAVDEFHQLFVPGRFSSASDAAADLLGGFAGVCLGIWLNELLLRKRATG
jgi:VanZ family protein